MASEAAATITITEEVVAPVVVVADKVNNAPYWEHSFEDIKITENESLIYYLSPFFD